MSYSSVEQSTSYMTVVMNKRHASVSFYPNSHKRKGDLYYLYARVIYMRKKAEFSLAVLVTLDEWDFERHQLTNKNKNMNAHKVMIEFESEVLKILDDRIARGLPVSAKIIKRIIDGDMAHDSNEGAVYMLIPFIDSLVALMRKNKSEYTPGTIQHYTTLIGHLKEFIRCKGIDGFPLHLIDSVFLQEFDDHLMTWQHPKLHRSMNRNTCNKYHSKLRAVLHDAVRRKLISDNPYSNFKLKRVIAKSDYLINQEISLIANKRFDSPSLELTRDYLLMSLWMGGTRFSDLKMLKEFNIYEEDGFYFLHLKSQEKTENSVHTPLLPGAVAILKKHEEYRKRDGFLLPRLSQQKLNEYLKTIGDLSGVHKKMTHKIARHTFGTSICSRNGVPRHITATWMGHSLQIRSTDVYARVTKEESFFWLKKLTEIYSKSEYIVK
jgi:integrase/recombinase XerD